MPPISTFPPLPQETRLLASAMYGKGNLYIRLGDALPEIAAELTESEPSEPDFWANENNLRCALMTAIQFAEQLTNSLVVEAVRSRVELKYALHLPLDYPHIPPIALCEFRRELYKGGCGECAFQKLLNCLSAFGFFKENCPEPVLSADLLAAVCDQNRFEEVVEAFNRALESLAAADPEWLRRTALPYWYERYGRFHQGASIQIAGENWRTKVLGIAQDIYYLLEEIESHAQPKIARLQEVGWLRITWGEQFQVEHSAEGSVSAVMWREKRCMTCRADL